MATLLSALPQVQPHQLPNLKALVNEIEDDIRQGDEAAARCVVQRAALTGIGWALLAYVIIKHHDAGVMVGVLS